MRVEYDETCELHCTDNDKTATATVVNFRQGDGLTVFIADSKLVMKYNKAHDIYIGSLMGMEFTTKGPKYYEFKQGRQR
jgi:hypothetical protein